MIEDDPDPIEAEVGETDPQRVLLSGVCRLTFEGQRFVPDDDSERQCWLEVSGTAGEPLREMLGPDWNPTFDDFHAEFWGIMYWTPDGCGHLHMCQSFARMDELVSARIIAPPPSPPRKKHKSILERIRAGRAVVRPHSDRPDRGSTPRAD